MYLIEPCCTPKHLLELRGKLVENGSMFWHGYGDLSLAELLPHILSRYSEVDLMLVVPSLPDAAAKVVQGMMQKQRMRADGKGKLNAIKHLTLITDMRKKKSPLANSWLAENPFGERMTIINVQQNDTVIMLPDIAFFGNINLAYGGHFTAIITRNARLMADMKKNFSSLAQLSK